jgi:uncharacterized protein
MEILVISTAAFLVSILTFFSGFGLGTILTPVFMIYFATDLAIALTGIVHLCNNIFKFILVKKNIDYRVFLIFGLPAVCASIPGSYLLLYVSDIDPLYSYLLLGRDFSIVPVKLIIGMLLVCFALFDLLPSLRSLQFGKDKLVIGGLLSGFFGGLSGNQGALRSAFLVKAGLSKEVFIATTILNAV